jgi:hypothetical protein
MWIKTSHGQELVNLAHADRIYIESVDTSTPGVRRSLEQFELQTGAPFDADPDAPAGPFALRADLRRPLKNETVTLLVFPYYEQARGILDDIEGFLAGGAHVYPVEEALLAEMD